MAKENKIEIALDDGFKLVVEQNNDPLYAREVFIGMVSPNGTWVQDLAIIHQQYHYEPNVNRPVWDEGFETLVYADEDTEDCTDTFRVSMRKTEAL